MLEFGDGQADAIRKIFETEKWIVEAVKEDYSQRAANFNRQIDLALVIVIEKRARGSSIEYGK